MEIKYRLDNQKMRCNLIDGAVIMIEESGSLKFCFEGVKEGASYLLSLCDKNGVVGNFKIINGCCETQKSRLRIGTLFVELLEVGGVKYIGAPIEVASIAQSVKGLAAYPQIDEVLARLDSVEKNNAKLNGGNVSLNEKLQKQQLQINALIVALNNPL